jgi:hypothetical protein
MNTQAQTILFNTHDRSMLTYPVYPVIQDDNYYTNISTATGTITSNHTWRPVVYTTTNGTVYESSASTSINTNTTTTNSTANPSLYWDDTYSSYHISYYEEPSKEQLIRAKIRENLNFLVKTTRSSLENNVTPQEMKARNTLRDMITEKEWRRYVTNRFIMVKGASGRWYQIFENQEWLRVYEQGKLIDRICIHTAKDCPPTDHVINLKVLIETDENIVWKEGNLKGAALIKPARRHNQTHVENLAEYVKNNSSNKKGFVITSSLALAC